MGFHLTSFLRQLWVSNKGMVTTFVTFKKINKGHFVVNFFLSYFPKSVFFLVSFMVRKLGFFSVKFMEVDIFCLTRMIHSRNVSFLKFTRNRLYHFFCFACRTYEACLNLFT